MIHPAFLAALRKIITQLEDSPVNWVLTGSLSFALRGLPLEPHDIDLQTDEPGAYEIERHFASCVHRKVAFSSTEHIRSHFGALLIEGVVVEIMGDLQKRGEDGAWEPPVDLERHKRFVHVDGLDIPVLSLAYEAEAYRKLGRREQAELLHQTALQRAEG
jgi:hypothetical protein